jgi:hypothetical protein
MLPDGYMERLYPIGALPQRDVADIRLDAFCADSISIDALMAEWKVKSELFRSVPREALDAADSELIPFNATSQTLSKIEGLLTAYRAYLPTTYELAYVPISKLITPQTYVELDYARLSFQGLSRKLTDDEVAQYCLGAPVRGAKIDATFLGYPKGGPGESNYQFSSEDDNMRYIPPMPLKPLHDIDLSAEASSARYDVKAIPVLVGPGLPFIQILKVPMRMGREGGQVSRLIISNGVHRIFRLAELGNTHVAAIVQTASMQEVPDPFIEARRDALFGPSALRATDLANMEIGRAFRWKKSKRVLKLQVKVVQEVSLVP